MSSPYSSQSRNSGLISLNRRASVAGYTPKFGFSVSELSKFSFYFFICLWLLFGGLVEQSSASYIASNANFANASLVAGKATSSSSIGDNPNPVSAGIPLPGPSTVPGASGTYNLPADGQPAVNSTANYLKPCQIGGSNSALNIAKNQSLNGYAGLVGGLTTRLLSTSNTPSCNYSYYSVPNLISYKYSDNSFTQLVDVENEGAVNSPDSVISPTIYTGQVFFSAPGTFSYSFTGEYAIPDIFKLKINNQTVLDRSIFTLVDAENVIPCRMEGQGSINIPVAGWYPISYQISASTTDTHNDYSYVCQRNTGSPVRFYYNGPSQYYNYRSAPSIGHSFGFENCQVYPHGVTPGTGNFCYSATDLSLPGVAGSPLSLNISRNYNSYESDAGYYGVGWHSPYDMKLVIDYNTNEVTVFNPSGRQDTYEPNPNPNLSEYIAPSRANSTLSSSSTGYNLVSSDQITYTFSNTGSLTQITDRNSNQITLNYLGGNLSSISDSTGRSLAVTLSNNRISSVSDGTRSVSYSYDSTGNYLTAVTDVMGYSTSYEYDSSCLMMTKIIDQNGHMVLHNTYDTTTNQVIQQEISPATGTTYTAHYTYSQLNGFQTGQTTFQDVRGNTLTYNTDVSNLVPNQLTDPYGKTTSHDLNYNDLPATIHNARNVLINTSYNTFGRVTATSTTGDVNGASQTIQSSATYNSFNDPVNVTDPNSHIIGFGYDSKGNPTTVTNPLNQTTTMTYDAQGRVTSVTTVGGLVTTYRYNSPSPNQGLPSTITQTLSTLDVPTGTATPAASNHTYRTDLTYTPQGWVASKTDPYEGTTPGGSLSYEYNFRGQVVTTTNQLNQHAYNTYDPAGNLTQSINFLGQETDYTYDYLNRVTSQVQHVTSGNLTTSYIYDEAGNVVSMTDPRGVTTQYTYDANNRLTEVKVPLQAGGNARTSYTYDEVGNLKTVVRHNTGSGSGGDQTTSYDYDAANRLTQITKPDGTQEKFEYDAAGNVTKDRREIDGSNWSEINYTYDGVNRPTLKSVQGAVIAGGSSVNLDTTFSYNDPQNLVTATDPYGIKTETTSDPAGRVIQTKITPADNSQSQTSYNIFNPRSLLVTALSAANSRTDYTYDGLGRTATTTGYTGVGTTGTPLVTTYSYIDTATPKVTTIGPAPQNEQEEQSYDEAGRLIQSKVSNGANPLITSYSYDGQGNRTSINDPKGHVTNFGYENTGWLTGVTQTVTAGGSSQTLTTAYTYDQVGNQLSVTDPMGHITSYSYDALNRLTSTTDPAISGQLGNKWQYSYDGLGRLKTLIDGKNQLTQYTYDAASRLLNFTTDANGGNTSNRLTTKYTYNNGSQPLTMEDQSGGTAGPWTTTTYTYDGFNRLSGVTNPQGIVKYSYDAANRRSQLSFGLPGTADANLKQVTYGYDALDRTTAITATNWLGTPQSVGFNYSGQHLDKLLYPNGITATYSYDGAGRLTGINQLNSANSTVFSVAYTLDELGNRTAQNENLNGVNRQVNYSYDELSRLITESYPSGNPNSHPVTSTYTYDKAGNRTQMVTTLPANTKGGTGPLTLTTNYTYNEANQLTTRSDTGTATPFNSFTFNYTYDANGSLVSEATNTTSVEATNYSYDVRNRLSGWQKSAKNTTISSASFSYDGTNNRLSMTYGGQTTTYLQDAAAPLPVVLLEKKGSNDPSLFMYPLGASTTPLFAVSGSGSATPNGLWYHSDGLGSVRALTLSSGSSSGASGTVVDTSSYSAFGLSAGENNSGNTGKVDTGTHKFGGEQLDPTGLYYNRARYYNPVLGRFIGRDPVGATATDPSTLNRYVYAANNPGLLIDPSGNCVEGSYGCSTLNNGITAEQEQQKKDICNLRYNINTCALAYVSQANPHFFFGVSCDQGTQTCIIVPKNTGFGGGGGGNGHGGNKDSDISFAKSGKGESGGGLSGSKSERPTWQQKLDDLLATMEPSPTEDVPNNGFSTKNEGRLIYRSMIDDGGQPKIGDNARSLGVRTTGSRIDINPDSNGNVRPQNKPEGMSVSPDDPMNAQEHRRPPEFGGTGKDPMWCMNTCDLPSDLNFKQDSSTHGVIEPAKDMSLDDYKNSLNSTQGFWRQVGRNNTGV